MAQLSDRATRPGRAVIVARTVQAYMNRIGRAPPDHRRTAVVRAAGPEPDKNAPRVRVEQLLVVRHGVDVQCTLCRTHVPVALAHHAFVGTRLRRLPCCHRCVGS